MARAAEKDIHIYVMFQKLTIDSQNRNGLLIKSGFVFAMQ